LTGKKEKKIERGKVMSKVKNIISQNATLRLELERLRKQLDIERETLYRLEKEEKNVKEEEEV
jgi:regulator of replication initiation timing